MLVHNIVLSIYKELKYLLFLKILFIDVMIKYYYNQIHIINMINIFVKVLVWLLFQEIKMYIRI